MKNPQARKKRHARTKPRPKCWICGSTRSIVTVNSPQGGQVDCCPYHLPASK